MPGLGFALLDFCARVTTNETGVPIGFNEMPCTQAWSPMNFLTTLVLIFAFFLLLTGAFTAYFGSGKSRKVGAGLLAGGLVLGILWIVVFGILNIGANVPVGGLLVETLGVLLAAMLGAAAAIGLFLMAIMKS